jgi:low temperature requirement protein LtrA
MTDDANADESAAAPLIQPPRLLTAEHRTASRLELFFDLAYLLVVSELVTTVGHDLTWHGAVVFAGLFTVTWWSWVTTTLYANRFDTNDVPYRIAKLAQTFAVIVMAASAAEAVGDDAAFFAAGYVATRVVLVLLYLRAYRHVGEARTTLTIYGAGATAGAALWLAGLAVPDGSRYWLWGAGVLVEMAAPVLATRFGGDIPLHEEHLPDRFGLFTILVLGESITSVAVGLRDTEWRTASFLVAAAGFLIAATIWWNYFDIGGASGKQHLVEDDDSRSDERHDRYVFGHLPLLLGMAAVGVGIEQFVVHPTGSLSPGGRWALCAGAGLFLVGIALVMAGTSRSWWACWPWPAAAVPVPFLAGLPADLDPWITVSIVAGALLVTVVAGVRQQQHGRLETVET